jgi:radical SAM protein with 4Fe4S-binding SPASM domain
VDDVVQTCRAKVDHTAFLRQIPHDKSLGVLSPAQWMEVLEGIYFTYCQQGRSDRNFVSVRDIHWSHLFMEGSYRCDYLSRYPTLVIVESNGDVYVCRRSGIVLGNVFRESLIDIFQTSATLPQIRNRQGLSHRCQSCSRLGVCGGCRGMALAVYGDMMAEDPQCCLNEFDRGLRRPILRRQSKTPLPTSLGNRDTAAEAVIVNLIRSLKEYSSLPLTAKEKSSIFRSARKKDVRISKRELQNAADSFRATFGLNKAEDTTRWLRSHQISLEQFQDYLAVGLLRAKVEASLEGTQRS